MRTLAHALEESRGIGPGFHLLRHLLSLVILAHHCRVAVFGVGYSDSYNKGVALTASAASKLTYGHLVVELLRPGLFALVGMFFALSGFLVMSSAIRNPSVKVFFANRALRIVPALAVEVTLSALILGPIVTNVPLSDYFLDHKFFAYFGNIVGLVTFELPGVFASNPWPRIVNANLWTLPAEFWCYFIMLVGMATGLIARRRDIVIAVAAALIVWTVLGLWSAHDFSIRDDATHFTKWYVVMMFFIGAAFYLCAAWVPLRFDLFVACAAAYYVLTLFDRLGPLSGVALTYCTAYIGLMKFPTFDRLVPLDLSYGTYLYGFPITQAMIYYVLPYLAGLSVGLQFVIVLPPVIALTAAFSIVSWTYIEKPALSLRRHVLREPPRAASQTT